MAKQTLIIETAKELSLNDGMIVITDRETGHQHYNVSRQSRAEYLPLSEPQAHEEPFL